MKPFRVDYEWLIEAIQAKEPHDIVDLDHYEKCPGDPNAGPIFGNLPGDADDGEIIHHLGICCDEICDHPDDNRRSWAYVKPDHTLPEWFEDAYQHKTRRVPKHFAEELARKVRKQKRAAAAAK